MPIYEYRCRACGQEFEKFVATAGAAVACTACAAIVVSGKLSVFGLKTCGAVMSSVPSGGGGCCGGGCGCH